MLFNIFSQQYQRKSHLMPQNIPYWGKIDNTREIHQQTKSLQARCSSHIEFITKGAPFPVLSQVIALLVAASTALTYVHLDGTVHVIQMHSQGLC